MKASDFIFPSWKTREEYRSSRDVGYLVPVWFDDKSTLIFPMDLEEKLLEVKMPFYARRGRRSGRRI